MKIKYIILTLLFLMSLGCESLIKPEDDYIYDKSAFLKIVADDTVKAGQIFKVEIYGWLPNRLWELYKIEIEESGNEFILIPIIRIRKDKIGLPVLAVVVGFSASVELMANPNFDIIKISAIGKNETVEKIIRVSSKR